MYPLVDLIEHQTIVALQNKEDLDVALASKANVVFLLTGSIFNTQELVARIKAAGKHVFLHLEFLEGIAADKSGVAYVAQHICPTGIISTRSNMIKVAKELNLLAIQRIFLIDTSAVHKGMKVTEQSQPDAIEVMPGIMPRVIHELTRSGKLDGRN